MCDIISSSQFLLLLGLLAAHLIADFLLQNKSHLKQRYSERYKSKWLYLHGSIAGLLAYLVVWQWYAFWIFLVIAISHIVIDLLKSYYKDSATSFIIDQFCHFIIILICWIILIKAIPLGIIDKSFSNFIMLRLVVMCLSYFIIIWPASYFIEKFTDSWRKQIIPDLDEGLYKAGVWIGRLERILILTFILQDQYAAVGFLIAAKSILRFGDTNPKAKRKLAEYILIGTLLSFLIALLIGFLANFLLSEYGK